MPQYTEARIRALCVAAIEAKKPEDINRVLPELRAALGEHIQLAKDSLETQKVSIASVVAVSKRA